jgi:hypothetical protein
VLLAVLHAAALVYWLYLLSMGPSLTSSGLGAKQLKKLRVVYDFLESPATVIGSRRTRADPMKRNVSYPSFRSTATSVGL